MECDSTDDEFKHSFRISKRKANFSNMHFAYRKYYSSSGKSLYTALKVSFCRDYCSVFERGFSRCLASNRRCTKCLTSSGYQYIFSLYVYASAVNFFWVRTGFSSYNKALWQPQSNLDRILPIEKGRVAKAANRRIYTQLQRPVGPRGGTLCGSYVTKTEKRSAFRCDPTSSPSEFDHLLPCILQ